MVFRYSGELPARPLFDSGRTVKKLVFNLFHYSAGVSLPGELLRVIASVFELLRKFFVFVLEIVTAVLFEDF